VIAARNASAETGYEPASYAFETKDTAMPPSPSQAIGGRSRFDRFAEASSALVSSGTFFGVSLILVVLWMPTIAFFNSVDTWQLVINTATSILAFLLVALLQNSERRKDQATLAKLDTLAAGMAALMHYTVDGDEAALARNEHELRDSVGLEQRI
jgi:low affinity Fe/Cu permease